MKLVQILLATPPLLFAHADSQARYLFEDEEPHGPEEVVAGEYFDLEKHTEQVTLCYEWQEECDSFEFGYHKLLRNDVPSGTKGSTREEMDRLKEQYGWLAGKTKFVKEMEDRLTTKMGKPVVVRQDVASEYEARFEWTEEQCDAAKQKIHAPNLTCLDREYNVLERQEHGCLPNRMDPIMSSEDHRQGAFSYCSLYDQGEM